jgi:hypothetical protein
MSLVDYADMKCNFAAEGCGAVNAEVQLITPIEPVVVSIVPA